MPDLKIIQQIVEAETIEERMKLVEANKSELTGESDQTVIKNMTTKISELTKINEDKDKLYRDTFFSGVNTNKDGTEGETEDEPNNDITLESMGF